MIEMGFQRAKAIEALEKHKNDLSDVKPFSDVAYLRQPTI
jgi:hypothetical protein